MKSGPRVVLLTGNELRHRFAANRLAQKMALVGVVSEVKSSPVDVSEELPLDDRAVIDRHFAERDEVERKMLGCPPGFTDSEALSLLHGRVNTLEVFEWVKNRNPDIVLLYGTSIIKPPLLDFYSGRMINLHLGLSPYYRGSGTNFWPLVNREPECVGATIHLAVAKVDAGPILAQIRPRADVSDRAHELGTMTIMTALDVLPGVVSRYLDGELVPQDQDLSQGRVYKRRDFTAQAVRTMWEQFETGMMTEYVADSKVRCQRFPIVEPPQGMS